MSCLLFWGSGCADERADGLGRNNSQSSHKIFDLWSLPYSDSGNGQLDRRAELCGPGPSHDLHLGTWDTVFVTQGTEI